jgi:hypothetical protein
MAYNFALGQGVHQSRRPAICAIFFSAGIGTVYVRAILFNVAVGDAMMLKIAVVSWRGLVPERWCAEATKEAAQHVQRSVVAESDIILSCSSMLL